MYIKDTSIAHLTVCLFVAKKNWCIQDIMICFRYEEKRVRKVNERWMVGRPWLTIIDENSMICTWCTQSDANNSCSFTWNSAKLETLKLHESSKIHEKNAIIEGNKSMPVMKSCIKASVTSMYLILHCLNILIWKPIFQIKTMNLYSFNLFTDIRDMIKKRL